jgi:metallophosphoesterase (TIGR00282 family)
MNILFIGDIFGSAGRGIVEEQFSRIASKEKIDLAIANVENAAGGFGVTPQIADEMLRLGIDVLTSGNHIWDRREIYAYLDERRLLLRPANYPPGCPGRGVAVVEAHNGTRCAVLNLQGRTYMPPSDCPFRKADELLGELDPDVRVRFVDFHAEVTSEKVAMGWHLDGRVSAMVGTHTHVPTADTRILRGGTAYQTDSGMTGPYDSVIGVEKERIIGKFQTSLPVRMEAARGMVELHGVVVEVDESTGKARSIKRIRAKHEGYHLEQSP